MAPSPYGYATGSCFEPAALEDLYGPRTVSRTLQWGRAWPIRPIIGQRVGVGKLCSWQDPSFEVQLTHVDADRMHAIQEDLWTYSEWRVPKSHEKNNNSSILVYPSSHSEYSILCVFGVLIYMNGSRM
jgi:hypothetical protein